MSMIEVPLAEVGLLTLVDVAKRMKCTVRAVQKWVAAGLLPVVVASSGKRAVYLVREKDLKDFERPTQGRPSKKDH